MSAKGLAAKRAKREAGETIEVLDPIEKARRNPHSLRAAINGKCWDCQGGYADPKPQQRIGECPSSQCCLWPVRPYQPKEARGTGEDES